MQSRYEELVRQLDRAAAINTALILFEWDNETLAPEDAGEYTAKMQGVLSSEYQSIMTGDMMKELLLACKEDNSLDEVQQAIVREAGEELTKLSCIPPEEYRAFTELTAKAGRIWMKAKQDHDFDAYAPTLKEIISYQKKFASYRAKEGQKLYDVMLDGFEKDFDMEHLDVFFAKLKEELVPLLKKIVDSGRDIPNDFIKGDFSEDKQHEAAKFLAEYVGFDFKKGVLAVSAHPFTTNLHNHDVRITTKYGDWVDSSIFSVIHEAGHAIYELGIADNLTQTLIGQGTSMGMHESQSRFFENIIGRNPSFWSPVYSKLQEWFPEQLGKVSKEQFILAVNKVTPGLVRIEADELTYSLHIMIRYELEKQLIEEDLEVEQLAKLWADKYEEYLGIRPEQDDVGVLQDIHWSQGSFGYFPSYALGSAFAAQMYAYMKTQMDFDGLLEQGKISEIREFLRVNIHQYGKLRTSRQLLKDMTGEDFNPDYYINYLKEKYQAIYQL